MINEFLGISSFYAEINYVIHIHFYTMSSDIEFFWQMYVKIYVHCFIALHTRDLCMYVCIHAADLQTICTKYM